MSFRVMKDFSKVAIGRGQLAQAAGAKPCLPVVDSHCHLSSELFWDDQEAVVDRAVERGVGAMVTISCEATEAELVIHLAEKFERVFCTVGVHPHLSKGALSRLGSEGLYKDLERWLIHDRVVGVGETGLDLFKNQSPKADQMEGFRVQLRLALAHNLPLVVHSRDAPAETLQIFKEVIGDPTPEGQEPPLRGVMHCFAGDIEFAKRCIRYGFMISFSGTVTFKANEVLKSVVPTVPSDWLLVETDAPFLAPMPHRGNRNEPMLVVSTLKTVADLRGEPEDLVTQYTTENFFRLFPRALPVIDLWEVKPGDTAESVREAAASYVPPPKPEDYVPGAPPEMQGGRGRGRGRGRGGRNNNNGNGNNGGNNGGGRGNGRKRGGGGRGGGGGGRGRGGDEENCGCGAAPAQPPPSSASSTPAQQSP